MAKSSGNPVGIAVAVVATFAVAYIAIKLLPSILGKLSSLGPGTTYQGSGQTSASYYAPGYNSQIYANAPYGTEPVGSLGGQNPAGGWNGYPNGLDSSDVNSFSDFGTTSPGTDFGDGFDSGAMDDLASYVTSGNQELAAMDTIFDAGAGQTIPDDGGF